VIGEFKVCDGEQNSGTGDDRRDNQIGGSPEGENRLGTL
jgi:hypothetical protein